MTLEEAKLNIEISIKSPLFGRKSCVVSIEAIDTVLKALEDITNEKKRLTINYEVLQVDIAQVINDLGLPEDTIIADEMVSFIKEKYIPKEKVRKKIEQLTENDNLVINEKWDSVDVVCAKREEMAVVDALQELLGE